MPHLSHSVKPINEKYRGFCKGARPCFDVLQFDTAYEKAVKYAVGNALIADDSSVASHICYEKNQQLKGKFYFNYCNYS
jgi:chromosome segregation ATPase